MCVRVCTYLFKYILGTHKSELILTKPPLVDVLTCKISIKR